MKALFALVWIGSMQAADIGQTARAWREQHERAILSEYLELLALPNIARDIPAMRRNAALIQTMLEKRRIATRLLELDGAPPVVYGERETPGATRTLLFYAHYDGQPVEPGLWKSGGPFQPVLMSASLEDGGKPVAVPAQGRLNPEWRVYARSAGDDKAPLIAWTSALDAMDAAAMKAGSNLKFFLDGEEEAGSPHMTEFIRKNRKLLAADAWIFCDGPVHQSRKQQVVFGVRGSATLDVTVYGARRELHSGHYGNWAPNPALMLAHLVASMRDEQGKVLVKGFYDDVEPLGETERRALAAAPDIDTGLKRELWLNTTEGDGRRLDFLINLPALNIHGINSAGTGAQARNVIPTAATATIGLRLVKGTDYRKMQDLVIDHIRRQGYLVADSEPDEQVLRSHPKVCRVRRRDGYNAVRAPMDLDICKRVVSAIQSVHGDVVLMPTLGGSLPIAPIQEIMGAPVVVVPIANHDNNQHGHDENMRLQNLWDGIETMAALFAMR